MDLKEVKAYYRERGWTWPSARDQMEALLRRPAEEKVPDLSTTPFIFMRGNCTLEELFPEHTVDIYEWKMKMVDEGVFAGLM